MKIQRLFLVLLAMFLFIVTGCVNGIENEEQKIEVEKRIGDENKYEDYKEITNNEQVQEVKKILDNIDWEIAKVNMASPADYRFVFQFKNPEIEAKAVLYELWISPNKDKVELIIDAESKYFQLNEEGSAVLFEILTGGKLSEVVVEES
ncbi:hypothetical protein F0342_10885 [Bacillus sp. CH30_1T]|uniref:hypothetical protein n=1 Tax=Bacillus sp. CH30_1T TaxID=2604836 RepID=UPI0011EFB732|nr:hypothetical protein [Bacillus sp. CH30_1T]KAA0564645.1 hypothetical protein F0342_10885 [Bacillus sp. CH30_1T]